MFVSKNPRGISPSFRDSNFLEPCWHNKPECSSRLLRMRLEYTKAGKRVGVLEVSFCPLWLCEIDHALREETVKRF
ncbi:hypothetical protein CEXT_126991 [Caerostris extrusa]|uniref:Uncharacterized protein n=1 Tax=Caerostris extrusa TaxID=172846 RepID=A0AAV4YE59_CAEEX|nr:hypothetical protein CEXT_126991 [Caerostris extrusa]